MTGRERVSALRERMAALREKRERRKTAGLGAVCAGLAACLAALIFDGRRMGGTAGSYAGAAMLFEDAGGYVLAAVAAFMTGVVITVLCIRYGRKRGGRIAEQDGNGERRETE